MPRHLAGHLCCPHVLGCAEGRRAGLHIHVTGKRSVDHRQPRRDHLQQRDTRERFGRLLHDRARQRHRCHGARQRERRDDGRLTLARKPHSAVEHWRIVFQRRTRIDVRVHPWLGGELLMGQPARDPHHLHDVFDALFAQRIGVDDFVRERQFVVEAVEMPDRSVDIDGLDRITARHMDAVEVLRQLDQVLKCRARADLAANVQIGIVRRRGHVDEQHVLAANSDRLLGVARRDRELGGGLLHLFHHEGTIHPYPDVTFLHDAACAFQDFARLVMQEVDADLFQDAHGTIVHSLDTLGAERLSRPVRVGGDAPRHLIDGVPAHPLAAPRTSSAAPAARRAASFDGFAHVGLLVGFVAARHSYWLRAL